MSNEEEKKASEISPENQIQQIPSNDAVEIDIDQKIKDLEAKLPDVRLDFDQKEIIRGYYKSGQPIEEINAMINKFLKELLENKNLKWRQKKQLQKVAPLYDTHDFWDSQPVPKESDIIDQSAYDNQIDTVKKVADISEDPLPIPAGFNWAVVNIEDDNECKEVYDLLTQNYVEDDENMFRFDYQVKFLQWALTPPGYKKDWLFGVRGGKKNKLFGFISGIPVHMNVNGKKITMAEINFLCVHKHLRSKRLAPILIREITRRVNLKDIWQAVYTAGITLPTPVSSATYWHRSLNPKKLVEVRFSSLPPGTPMGRYMKLNKIKQEQSIPGLRPMEKRDITVVTQLLNNYLAKQRTHIIFSHQEVKHFFMPRDKVINSFVVENVSTITDFFSFYSLPSTILKNEQHKELRVAYSYYNISTTNRLKEGMEDMLVVAKEMGYDVFNALDVMENDSFLSQLKFNIGDGHLHYYIYNWRVGGGELLPQDLGLVLV